MTSYSQRLSGLLQDAVMRSCDEWFAHIPNYPRPSQSRLDRARIVAHRGDTENGRHLENTMDAFSTCLNNRIWGIELDVRWSRDGTPYVLHDPDGGRVFQQPEFELQKLSDTEISLANSKIPRLQEVIDQFGKKLHLMIELKESVSSDSRRQKLRAALAKLKPEQDYHFLFLNPGLVWSIDFVPRSALLPVAQVNTKAMSRLAIEHRWGGISGHYLLLNEELRDTHQSRGQKVGTGFVSSANVLYREVQRNVDWIFTNNAIFLQSLIGSGVHSS